MSEDRNRMAELLESLRNAQESVAFIQSQLNSAKEIVRFIETQALPELMHEMDIVEFTSTDGLKVRVASEVECAITEANRERAHAWLRERGFGGLIKSVVAVPVPQGEDEEAGVIIGSIMEAMSALELEANIELTEKVHHATLKAFVKEQLAAGTNLPADLFSLFPYERAKVTRK